MSEGPLATRLQQQLEQISVFGDADLRFGRAWRKRLILEEDFAYASAADPNLIMPPWAVDLQTANITGDFVDDAISGVLRFASDATNEAQAGQLFMADQLMISFGRPGFVECAILPTYAGATLSADERWIFGLGSAHANAEDGLDAVTTHAWFRIEGASNALLIEKDDGVDIDDVDTGRTLTPAEWHHLLITWDDQALCRYYLDGQKVGQLSMGGLATPDAAPVQPIFCYQRDAGTEINTFDLDFARVGNLRRLAQP